MFGAVGIPAAYLGTLLNRHVDQPVLLIAFACLTLLAAAAMLWRGQERPEDEPELDGGAGTAVATRHATVTAQAAKIVVCGVATGCPAPRWPARSSWCSASSACSSRPRAPRR